MQHDVQMFVDRSIYQITQTTSLRSVVVYSTTYTNLLNIIILIRAHNLICFLMLIRCSYTYT